jgi:hypothetical protein
VAILILSPFLVAQEAKSGIDVILNHYAAWNFIPGVIPRVDLDRIVQAGIRAQVRIIGNRGFLPWYRQKI